jgi:probable rRNA maturation factor
MAITLKNLQKKIPLNLRQIKLLVRAALDFLRVSESGLSFVFVTHQKMRALNRRYYHLDNSTDVLSFDLGGKTAGLRGEIIISPESAAGYVRENGGDLSAEIMLYAVHGILHLAGYDDHRPADTARMRAKEQEIMRALGVEARQVAHGH